jgi:hypothetical protein
MGGGSARRDHHRWDGPSTAAQLTHARVLAGDRGVLLFGYRIQRRLRTTDNPSSCVARPARRLRYFGAFEFPRPGAFDRPGLDGCCARPGGFPVTTKRTQRPWFLNCG